MEHFAGRVAVITGAAGGIGSALARALAARGCHLALCDLHEERLGEVARELEAPGRVVSTHVVDVSDKRRVEALVREVVDIHHAVHILINNAGVTVLSTFDKHTMEDFEWLFGINFWGVIYGCNYFLPELMKVDEAHIVNLSSLFGVLGIPGQSSYCASKFAVRGFTKTLRAELATTHVGVTCIHPGGVATGIARQGRTISGDPELEALHRLSVDLIENRSISPDEAAAQIVRAIEKNSARVMITRAAHIADRIQRFAPGLMGKLVARGWQKTRSGLATR